MMGNTSGSNALSVLPFDYICKYMYIIYNFSQTPPLLKSIVMECVCPCALHAILARFTPHLYNFLPHLLVYPPGHSFTPLA